MIIDQARSTFEESNSFVGRERELDELRQFARSMRAVTLCGSGGIGKTRLALRVLAGLTEDFSDGVWFIELGDLRRPELVVSRVASVIGVEEEPGRPLLDTLADALRPRRLLLALDNCEHLIDSCARLCHRLLASSPGLRLPTSGRRPAPPRQRTLRAAIDWSHDLLAAREQVLLRRLSVCAGWSLEMAEQICSGDDLPAADVLDLLATLAGKSLVVADTEAPGHTRYRMLDTIREYSSSRLSDAAEAVMMRRRLRD